MRIVLVSRQEHELSHAGRLPGVDEVIEPSVQRLSSARRSRATLGAAWAAAVAIAVLAASRWLDAPTVQYLVVWGVATIAGAFFAWRLRAERRRWAVACSALVAAALVFAIREQRELATI